MIPTIIDIEASGFGRNSYPIEVGFVRPDREAHCYIIRPHDGWTAWDESAEALHGISRETLEKHGREPLEVALRLNELLAGETIYSDAWGQDISWLGKLYDWVEIPQRFRLESLGCLLTEEQTNLWHATKAKVMDELDLKRHRASSDALILLETYLRTRGE